PAAAAAEAECCFWAAALSCCPKFPRERTIGTAAAQIPSAPTITSEIVRQSHRGMKMGPRCVQFSRPSRPASTEFALVAILPKLTCVQPQLSLATTIMSPAFHYSTIARLTAGIRSKKISPVEVVDATLARITECEGRLNPFAHFDRDAARRQALSAEAAAQRGDKLGPLHGIPLSIKSNIDVAVWHCAAGSTLRKDYVAQQDAVLLARLKFAGAILLANTNTPEFLMAYESSNLLNGRTSNPWDLTRTAGGSSGGEAAAISSGCSAGGVGSDGGGSIRVPAHFCGICGLKPTPGRIPMSGHYLGSVSAFGWLGAVGPMARTIGDLRILFDLMCGPDAGDAMTAPVPVREGTRSNAKLRIGILEGDALGRVTPETQTAVRQAAQHLAFAGFELEPFKLNNLERVLELWWFFFGTVVGELLQGEIRGREGLLSAVFCDYLDAARPAGSKALTMLQFMGMCAARDRERKRILHALRDVPILLSAVSVQPAFRHGEGSFKPGSGYRDTARHSQWLNLVGCRRVPVPMAKWADGLPIGVQIAGRRFEDELVLAVAERLEEARGFWEGPVL